MKILIIDDDSNAIDMLANKLNNYDDIETFIATMDLSGESPFEVGRDNMDNLANQVKELEERIKELESKND